MPVLSLAGVSLSFTRGQRITVHVLKDVSLQVGAGEIVAVLAARAQGKTTLLRVAAGMVRPNCGQVFLEGDDLWCLSARQRATLFGGPIGWVANTAPELDMPVLANVALPLLARCGKDEAYARAMVALERVGASDCAPQRWGSLADWERALVAIAQGIVRDPKLLLVDDLTVSLGLGESYDVTRLLGELAEEQGFGVLMCVSDTRASRSSRRVLSLAAGELEESRRAPERTGNVFDFPSSDPLDGGRRASW
jgi:predicted ABC-type transport system involved in lysophospholipase L1 biosynthesis ATPase subunit